VGLLPNAKCRTKVSTDFAVARNRLCFYQIPRIGVPETLSLSIFKNLFDSPLRLLFLKMEQKIKKKYDGLKEKYSLPDFDELNNEFEISTIEHEDFLLRQIRKKIADKINVMGEFLECLLSPDTAMANLYEYKAFDDNERKKIFELYKRLKVLEKLALELSLNHDDEKDAEFIKDVFSSWNKMRSEITSFIKKIKNFWENESTEEYKAGYFG